MLVTVAGIALVSTAHAQDRLSNELFCNEAGNYVYQALADYRNGLSQPQASLRVDGYICPEAGPNCDMDRTTLVGLIGGAYQLADSVHLRDMPSDRYLRFIDMDRTASVSTCVRVSRHY